MKILSKITNKINQERQGNIDLKKIVAKLEYFSNFDEEQEKITNLLEKHYEEYINTISISEMAVSLETASLLYFMCLHTKPSNVLDLGSGFSSFVLRKYQKLVDNAVNIYSIDDNEDWLIKTKNFLDKNNLDSSNLLTYNDLISDQAKNINYDIVFYDLGAMNTRIEELFNILEIGESALIILDDFHKGNYQYQAKKILNNQGYKYYSLRKKTIDKYNRYAYLAFKN